MNADIFDDLLAVMMMEKGKRPTALFVYVCVYVCVCAMRKLYSKRAFLKAFHSLTFGQTSCRFMSSSR